MNSSNSFSSTLYGGECSDSRPFPLYPGQIASDTNYIGNWVGCRAGLQTMEKENVFSLLGDRTPTHRSSSP
jgi:hypothetical protein